MDNIRNNDLQSSFSVINKNSLATPLLADEDYVNENVSYQLDAMSGSCTMPDYRVEPGIDLVAGIVASSKIERRTYAVSADAYYFIQVKGNKRTDMLVSTKNGSASLDSIDLFHAYRVLYSTGTGGSNVSVFTIWLPAGMYLHFIKYGESDGDERYFANNKDAIVVTKLPYM